MTGNHIEVRSYRSFLGEPGYIACLVIDNPHKFRVVAMIFDDLDTILGLADALDLPVVSEEPTAPVIEWIKREYNAPSTIPDLEFQLRTPDVMIQRHGEEAVEDVATPCGRILTEDDVPF